jgi:Mor family transcriptional regulator
LTCIYALIDPETELIRYVGMTSQKLRYRINQHMRDARIGKIRRESGWLRKLGRRPKHVILEYGCDDNWQERERYWIALCRECGFPLTNLSDGGDGASGPRSDEFKARMAEVAKETKNALGHVLSDKSKEQISRNLKKYYENGGPTMGGERNGQSKLTEEQAHEIRKTYASGGISIRKIARQYGVTYSCIRKIIIRKSWKHIE